jgi:hypothetical protein
MSDEEPTTPSLMEVMQLLTQMSNNMNNNINDINNNMINNNNNINNVNSNMNKINDKVLSLQAEKLEKRTPLIERSYLQESTLERPTCLQGHPQEQQVRVK